MRTLALYAIAALTGCASTTVVPVGYEDREAAGIRVYDPMPLLVVTEESSSVVFVPNFERGYSVNFQAWLARNDVALKTTDGALTDLSSRLDTSGPLGVLQSLGEKALEAAEKLRALGTDVPGSIPGKAGIWRFVFAEDGKLLRLEKVAGF